ncbi:hypothetical protein MUN84_00355 [Hymenobacter sp. 5516J-16]|uniref:hypothetical protein n=1 Tax=Hymenobacter sp. 5516J-16 TaxID=2932253 RepID=UPI001FD217EF|nr:hypothetical protein [Hymenobacter sp. 5516J-16]UOQ77232.1 hypothetical protein MUN84_00355 [Hymenobacter sp. 5516J-16]
MLAGISTQALLSVAAGNHPLHPAPARTAGTVRKHLVYFKDKAGTPHSISQPQTFLSARSVQRRQRQNIAILPATCP